MLSQEEVQILLAGSESVLARVHPVLAIRVRKTILGLAETDLAFGAFMGVRTFTEQDALFAQGRTTPGKRVTNAKGGDSWHNFGMAVDLVEDGDLARVGIQWSWKNNADYLRVGRVAKANGLEWGGFWKSFKDYPHVQLTMGMELDEANGLYAIKQDMKDVWAEVDKRLALAA